jgi:hypothetical protein
LDDFVDFVKEKKAKGVLKDTLVLSVFEAEEKDKELLTRLQNAVHPPPPPPLPPLPLSHSPACWCGHVCRVACLNAGRM